MDLKAEVVRLRRTTADVGHIAIPDDLAAKRLPDNMVFEFEQHLAYLRKKYAV